MITLFSLFYNVVWTLALPLLLIPRRIRRGWAERTVQKVPSGPFDIWLQAASAGEAQIALMLLEQLSGNSFGRPLRILATSGTPEGVEALSKTRAPGLYIQTSYFPFDAPFLMKKAFRHFSPKMAVIIETELWPGYLLNAKKNRIPVFIINGRMTQKSYGSYRLARGFFKTFGPDRVLAISNADRDRFSALIGKEKTGVMKNIKFDRINSRDSTPPLDEKLRVMATSSVPFIILGSIRREEEKEILKTIKLIIARRPEAVIGLFPKHLKRSDAWIKTLKKAFIPVIKRSEIGSNVSSGVVVWDRYGELAPAYALADAAFVGGSLADLGGQNFLEPLVYGLRPCIGPYWKNFSWVGDEVISTGLVHQVQDAGELADRLLAPAQPHAERSLVIEEVLRYLEPRKGGTVQACDAILTLLESLPRNNHE